MELTILELHIQCAAFCFPPMNFCFPFLTDVVRFDNSYSWVNAKKVLYSLEVLAPTGDLIADVDWVDGNSKVNGSK